VSADASRTPSRWVGLGTATVGVLTLVDVAGGLVEQDREFANLSGTLALAPALTGVGGTRRQTAGIGALALAMAVILSLADGVPLWAGSIRCTVVALAGVVSVLVAGHRRVQTELLQDRQDAARTLQAAMVGELPAHDDLELVARYLPAAAGDQVGGDWFDAVVDPHGVTTLVVGDVTGHDVRAAASMGQLRAMVRAYAVEGGSGPVQLLARLDAAVARLRLEVLATVVIVQIDPRGAVRWASAGHPAPIRDGQVLDGSQDVLVGVIGDPERHEHRTRLDRGGTLLLHTDGLVERREEDLRIGVQRLLVAVGEHGRGSLPHLLDGVLRDVLHPEHIDDVVVLAARRR